MIPYDKIREHYLYLTPLIMEMGNTSRSRWIDPYTNLVDWSGVFSPIELDAWNAIRGIGKCPLYPQYPVGKYFLDFGNPFMKIAIECDGKEYHLDKEKDNRRDYNLKQLGWKIYRIPGSDCRRPVSEEYYDVAYALEERRRSIISEFYRSTIEGLVNALAILYFGYETYWDDEYVNEIELAKECLQNRLSQPVNYL